MRYRHPVTGCRADQLFWPNIWLVEPSFFQDAVAVCRSIPLTDLRAMAKENQEEEEKDPTFYKVEGPVGIVPISGMITKHPSSFAPVIGGGSTLRAIQGLRNAAADPKVDRILLHIDNSPGGLVTGVPELVREIRRIDQKVKPIYVHADDGMMSAAYWIGSAGRRVTANEVAQVGSIGTMAVLYDRSEEFKQEGVKVIVVKAGETKGIGVPGTEITEEQQRTIQERINDMNKIFTAGVKTNRKLTDDELAAVTDARVHIAERAKALKLIDEIGTYEEVLADLSQKSAPRPVSRGTGGVAIPVAANEGSTKVYTADQMTRLRKLPGAAQATDEQAEAVALDTAERLATENATLTAEVGRLKAEKPTGPSMLLADPTMAAGHARLATKEIDLLQKGEKILPEQAATLKTAIMPDGKVDVNRVAADGTVLIPLDRVVAALDLNKPAGLLKETSASQVAPRTEPGAPNQTMTQAANAAVDRTIRRHYPQPAQANGGN